ncbi:ATP synthase F1 subunit delta [Lyngbya confervoides]|uniref:ATP synthase subunit delta n=1 Tax=Lyngbya confervoides BDU141951 TaxID=1574623 RepID=A0ABD4T5Z3_9CYAN|nr:ATP synthase F1 subunit delta [Lyngbya confervoides]MCM1984076.1 ATP synthase F1 subunit delta [Lyngbya confervoides BDU141951]
MKQTSVTAGMVEPYAEALMGIAQDSNFVDEIASDVGFMLEMLRESEDLRSFISNPLIKAEAKKAVLRQITEGRVQGVFFNILMLLVDRRRIFLLEAICKHFQSLVRKLKNTVLAEVTSTIELNEAQRQAVIAKVQHMTQASQVELETKIDPDLIGGVIIRIGSQVLDASIRGQLRRISNSLTSASA